MFKQSTRKVIFPIGSGNRPSHFSNYINGSLPAHFQHRMKLLIMLILPLFLFVAGAAHSKLPYFHTLPIAKVRNLPLGTEVTVEGTVTTHSGNFESSFFDKGFGLQDRNAGIYVSLQSDLGLVPGRQAHISGTLQDSSGLLILVLNDPSNITLDGDGHKIRPQWYATGRIGESTEGRIVRVVGKITQAPESDLPFGFKFFVDDGSGEIQVFINVQTGIDVSNLSRGQLVSVTGFSSQFDTHYEIDPRSPGDIDVPMLKTK